VVDARLQTWEVYYPAAAATGLPFARCRVDPTDVLWLHSAPPTLAVTVRQGDDRVIARGEPLERSGQRFPMTRLTRDGETVRREDRFPTQADLGELVLLPGGEAGHLRAWWNAADGSEWRWQVEFYNHR
jgi:hypothetical protein